MNNSININTEDSPTSVYPTKNPFPSMFSFPQTNLIPNIVSNKNDDSPIQIKREERTEILLARINAKTNFESSIPQMTINGLDNSLGGSNEVVLLNGNWDTSSKVPHIVAEMHNVNLDDLEMLKDFNTLECSGTGIGGKQMKMDTSLLNISSSMSSGISSTTSAIIESQSPLGSDCEIENDTTEAGSLSWLLNYKINELPPVPEHQTTVQTSPLKPSVIEQTEVEQQNLLTLAPTVEFHVIDDHGNTMEMQNKNNCMKQPQKSDQYVPATKYNGPTKPPFTYTELIEHALIENGELTVSGIYQWISDHFPYYKQNDDRWKNSVRHNLSINPHFRKGNKAVHGAGHLWTIAQKADQKSWQIKQQKMQQFIQNPNGKFSAKKSMELAAATASITSNEINYPNQTRHIQQPQDVAIEYVIDMAGGTDFLCPRVTKDEVANECGIGENDYLITDLNPATIFNMDEPTEIMTNTNLYDDLNFTTFNQQTE